MTSIGPPQPPNLPPGQDAFDAEMMSAGPAPMSGMAVAGFVSSVTVCCPVFSPLLGLIFSLVGLSQTQGGARRGRGLAIAGLIISLLVVPLQGWIMIAVGTIAGGISNLGSSVNELQGGNLDIALSKLYKLGSNDLRSSISEDDFAKWVRSEFLSRGGLQSIVLVAEQPLVPSPDQESIRIQWSAKFVEGTTLILMDLGFDNWGHMKIKNILIGQADLVAHLGDKRDLPGDDESTTDTESGGDQ